MNKWHEEEITYFGFIRFPWVVSKTGNIYNQEQKRTSRSILHPHPTRWGLIPLQRFSRCILQPQPTELPGHVVGSLTPLQKCSRCILLAPSLSVDWATFCFVPGNHDVINMSFYQVAEIVVFYMTLFFRSISPSVTSNRSGGESVGAAK